MICISRISSQKILLEKLGCDPLNSWPHWASPDCDVGRRHESTRHSARCSPWRSDRRVLMSVGRPFFGVANRGSWTGRCPFVRGWWCLGGWYFLGGNVCWVGPFLGLKPIIPRCLLLLLLFLSFCFCCSYLLLFLCLLLSLVLLNGYHHCYSCSRSRSCCCCRCYTWILASFQRVPL